MNIAPQIPDFLSKTPTRAVVGYCPTAQVWTRDYDLVIERNDRMTVVWWSCVACTPNGETTWHAVPEVER